MSCKYGEMQESITTYFTKLNNCYIIIENVPCLKPGFSDLRDEVPINA